ncbi:MAG: M23 family metallopeptidase, partial [Verrucomicrobiota bacterium]
MTVSKRFLLLILLPFFAGSFVEAGPIGLVLPTENDAIFSNDPSQFYMYTDRNFEGVISKPWQGGTYGFSRNQRRTSVGIVYTRFHEGVDIKPLYRDASGNPLDDIRAIADGTVVYVNSTSSLSSYGKYVVVHHDWGEGPFFSLYAHLSSAAVTARQQVKAGQPIAKMGYTGVGLNRERSHLHLELCMILSDQFPRWYGQHF